MNMENTADIHLIYSLMDQVRFTCVALEDLKGIVETPEDLEKIEAVLNDNRKVIERASEELKTTAV